MTREDHDAPGTAYNVDCKDSLALCFLVTADLEYFYALSFTWSTEL